MRIPLLDLPAVPNVPDLQPGSTLTGIAVVALALVAIAITVLILITRRRRTDHRTDTSVNGGNP